MKFVNIIKGLFLTAGFASCAKIFHCTEKNTIALTFDDGPFEYTTELLDLLKKKNIRATFFINAENYWTDLPTSKSKQEVIKQQFEAGHQIASHTWKHEIPSSHSDIKSMMNKFDDWLESVIGERPRYFRAPLGNCGDDCINYFEELGYKVIQWDTDTNDWDKSGGVDERVKLAKEFLKKEWEKEKDNYLVLMHDVQKHTVKEIMPWVLENAPFDKYKFVTVAECLGDSSGMYASGNVKEVKEADTKSNASADNTTSTQGDQQTDKNIIKEDNPQNVVPNSNNTDSKSGLLSSDASKSFRNVLLTIVFAFILLYVSYSIMINN